MIRERVEQFDRWCLRAACRLKAGLPTANSSQNESQNERDCQDQRHHPPNPFQATRRWAFLLKFSFNKVVVIEILLGKIQSAVSRFLRPPGVLVGTAFGAGLGFRWHVRTAIRTGLWRWTHAPNAGAASRRRRRIPRPPLDSRPSARNRATRPACPSRSLRAGAGC